MTACQKTLHRISHGACEVVNTMGVYGETAFALKGVVAG